MTITPKVDIDTIAEGVIQKVQLNDALLIPPSEVIDLIHR